MRIYADLHGVTTERKDSNLKPESTHSNPDKREYTTRNPDSHSIIARTSHVRKERQLIDALSIAQIAQSLIMKAITISSRLRNISHEAIITAKIDTQEFDRAISEINTSLRGINNIYTSPVLRAYSDITNEDTTVNAHSILPNIRNEIDSLFNLTSKPGIPDKNAIEKIDGIIGSLQKKSEKIATPPLAEKKPIIFARSNYDNSRNDQVSENIIKKVSGQIINNPQRALAAQGNIPTASVVNLFLS